MLRDLKVRWLGVTILLDLSLTILALLAARWLRTILPGGVYLAEPFSFAPLDEPLYFNAWILIPLVLLVWTVVFIAHSIYSPQFSVSQYERVQPIVVGVTGAVLILAGLAYFFFRELSRFLFLYFYLIDILFLVGWRKIAFRVLNQRRFRLWRPHERVVVVGQGPVADDVARAIEGMRWSGLTLVGFVHNGPGAVASIAELPGLIKTLAINEVIFALPPGHQDELRRLVLELQSLPVNLRLVPDVLDLVFVRAGLEDFAGLPMIGLREPALNVFDRLVKRSFDIVFSGALLLFSAPIFLIITLLMRFDRQHPGPIFFVQQRVGEGGRVFTMYKFRTMILGADEQEQTLLHHNGDSLGLNKHRDDPRVTPLGRFLRRSSLDELPQLLNVLRGDMSLVGPRPELPWLVEQYEGWQYQRFMVPQGMTGWWQVQNRGAQQAYHLRLEDDLYYIHNYSFLLDLRILWMTMGAVIRGDGAY